PARCGGGMQREGTRRDGPRETGRPGAARPGSRSACLPGRRPGTSWSGRRPRTTSRHRPPRRRVAHGRGTGDPAAPPTGRAARRGASRTRSTASGTCRLPSRSGRAALAETHGFQDFAHALPQRDRIERRGAVRHDGVVDLLLEEVAVRTGVGRELGGDRVLYAGRQAPLVVLALASEAELRRRGGPGAPSPPGRVQSARGGVDDDAVTHGGLGRGKKTICHVPPY